MSNSPRVYSEEEVRRARAFGAHLEAAFGPLEWRRPPESTGFGPRLKKLRQAAKLTQRALTQQVRCPQGDIARLENGKMDPPWSLVLELAKALRVELNAFLVEEGAET